MKKTAIIFVSLLLLLCLTVGVHAASVTTTPQGSTSASTESVPSDGMIYEADTALPLAICLFAALGFIVYGIVKIKKYKEEEKN